jgi:NADPH-dependent F420 reductase
VLPPKGEHIEIRPVRSGFVLSSGRREDEGMQIGFLGGTGIEGKGLALRFAAAGARVILGSRAVERAAGAALEYNRILGRPLIRGATNKEALSDSDIAFITVPFDQAVNAVESCRADFPSDLVLVDVTVPMRFKDGRAEYVEQERGSNAEMIAAHLPAGVHLVAAFKTIPAHLLAETERPLECDVFVCGESPAAKERVITAVNMIPALRPLDAGPLGNARILERMTVLAAQLNRRYKSRHARYRIVGI